MSQTLFYFPTLVANNETQIHEPYSPYFFELIVTVQAFYRCVHQQEGILSSFS